ncbi:MAG: ABC transporter ATP-binding protein [Bacillota bacterium]
MITAEGLFYRYPRAADYALNGVDFSVAPGEVFGLLGPSGAGKTTTQSILIGLLKNYQGTVSVGGRDLRRAGPDYYERIGVAFEFPNLYTKFTALENLTFFQSLYRNETEDPHELLALVGLEHATLTRVSEFSQGMKMRLRLCRAFINRPEVVFLDEPTASLDPVNARRVRNLIDARRDTGTTAVLSTHDMVTADAVCDRVAFIVDGLIRAVDSPRRLKMQGSSKRVRVECSGDEGKTAVHEFDLERLEANEEFARLLRQRRVETIHTVEPTLEDVFVKVTGRALQ